MSSRVFQSVVLQMKDSTDRAIGVIDSEGTVVACNELSCIGEHWPGVVEAVNRGDGGAVRFEGRTFKALAGWGRPVRLCRLCQGGGRGGPDPLRHGRGGPQRGQDLL